MVISEVVKSELVGYSINSVATQAGVSQSVLQRFASGETALRSDTIDTVAEYFGLELVKEVEFSQMSQEHWDEYHSDWWSDYVVDAWEDYSLDAWRQYADDAWEDYAADAWNDAKEDWGDDDYDKWMEQEYPEWEKSEYEEWEASEYPQWEKQEWEEWKPEARLESDAELYSELLGKEYVCITDESEVDERIKQLAAQGT